MSITNLLVAAWTEWITKANKAHLDNPPKLEELMNADDGLRGNAAHYTEFADRIIWAVYGKTRYNLNSSTKLFGRQQYNPLAAAQSNLTLLQPFPGDTLPFGPSALPGICHDIT